MRWLWFALCLVFAAPLVAQERTALVRLEPAHSSITAEGRDRGRPRPLVLNLGLSQPVPYRVYFLDGPPRLVVDFREVDFSGAKPETISGRELVPGLRWGRSRLIMELAGPYALQSAIQQAAPSGAPGASLRITLAPVKQADFVTRGQAMSVLRDLPQPALTAPPPVPPTTGRALRIAIDPGHGGHDPGAEVGAIREAAVMLGYARELSEVLIRAGFEVIETRKDDSFVGLERRMTIARTEKADLFISLHADALPAGEAAGLSIYTWNSEADDRAAKQLALRHDRADLVAGLDLTESDDQIAGVLMDLARQDTQPRSETFAKHLVSKLNASGIGMHRRPVRGAAFAVLKSPDIPSVLIELGFLTDASDRGNLFNPEWRRHSAQAIASAIAEWAQDDAIRSALSRR